MTDPKGQTMGIRRSSACFAVLVLVSATLMGGVAHAGTVKVNCATQSLQNKIDGAAPGSTLLVRGTCAGNFTIDKNLTLQGDPKATLDGSTAGRVLTIALDPTVRLKSLTVTGGYVSGPSSFGGGIYADGGKLILDRVRVKQNAVNGALAAGGGIALDAGTLKILNSTIAGNTATSVNAGSAAVQGAGVYSDGNVIVRSSTFSGNEAVASSVGNAGSAFGGGLFVMGNLSIYGSMLEGNVAAATGISTQAGGAGFVHSSLGGRSIVSDSTISNNASTANATTAFASLIGGGVYANSDAATWNRVRIVANEAASSSATGGAAATGGGMYLLAAVNRATGLRTIGNWASAGGGTSAIAEGGGVYDGGTDAVYQRAVLKKNSAIASGGTVSRSAFGGGLSLDAPTSINRSTIAANASIGTGTLGVTSAVGGGVYSSDAVTVFSSTISSNVADASRDGAGLANGQGGGLFVLGAAGVENSTIAANSVVSNAGLVAGTANAFGGGVANQGGTVDLVASTVADNTVGALADSVNVVGGGLFVSGGTWTLGGTIVANNIGSLTPECGGGPLGSAGYNLIAVSAGCSFTPMGSDLLDKDPKLGKLARNGGPTKTMAVTKGPALNVVPKAKCPVKVDQRGVKRPQQKRCEIGSYEYRP